MNTCKTIIGLRTRRILLLGLAFLLPLFVNSCATQQQNTRVDKQQAASNNTTGDNTTAKSKAKRPCPALRADRTIDRSVLQNAVTGGLGRWLRSVALLPSFKKGKFSGWQIESFNRDTECYEAAGFQKGDVVTSVNGLGLERPEAANKAFISLSDTKSVSVELQRDGKNLTVKIPIR